MYAGCGSFLHGVSHVVSISLKDPVAKSQINKGITVQASHRTVLETLTSELLLSNHFIPNFQ